MTIYTNSNLVVSLVSAISAITMTLAMVGATVA